jgi:hypothetical protein
VCGIKKWLLLPPNEEQKLKDKFNQLPFSIDERMLKEKDVKYFNIRQSSNEILFVPSMWYHQVFNITDVLSINHNWFNSCNINVILKNLVKNEEEVKSEISDCKEMENFEEHCQVMLKSVFGMSFDDLNELLIHIKHKRLNKDEIKLFELYKLGQNHIEHDLKILDDIFCKLKEIKSNYS